MPPERLAAYDEVALRELHAWKNPTRTVRGRIGDRIELIIKAVTGYVALRTVEKVLGWVLPRARDMTWRATSRPLVLRAYRRAGKQVTSIEDIAQLDLRTVDSVAGHKRVHEGAVAGVEGAAAGFFGGWTLAADIGGVMLLSMRAVQSRALVYGFDPSNKASSPSFSTCSTRLHVSGRTARRLPEPACRLWESRWQTGPW